MNRRDEIELIISHMQGEQPASVSIVGNRRIGKSSLLYHIFQTYEDRVSHVDQFVVIYLSLQQANCRNQDSFYQTVAEEFLKLPKVKIRADLADPLRVVPFDGRAFEQMLQAWKSAGVLPVICLDDFEELLDRTDRFDDGFYDNLRSLIGDRVMMLVIASRQRLMVYSRQKRLTSDFFNVFQSCRLQELSTEEAQDLVRLPHPDYPALGEEKRALALKWGARHPCLLQIAGRCLWDARQRDRSDDWARKQFEERAIGVPRKVQPMKQSFRAIGRLGSWAQGVGDTLDDLGNFVKGAFILVLVALVLMRAADWRQVQDWFQNAKEDTQQNFK